MKTKFRKAIDCILNKDDTGAKKLIREGIQQNEKYITYKKQLSEMGLNYEKVLVEDNVYDSIKIILEKFDKNLQLKILDVVYAEIAKPNRLEEAKKKVLMEQKRRKMKTNNL